MNNLWAFRKISAIEEPIFNNTLERFYNLGIDGLVRENIQNSLDGRLPEASLPVRVIINTGNMNLSQIPGIDEVHAHIRALKGGNSYTKETIDHMIRHLDDTQIPFISFEDQNTKGLTGAEHGENYKDEDTWGVYAYKKGVHFTESDSELENIRGGSHGVGKIACNAASDLYIMFFSNCDQKNQQHIGGTVQLIEHELSGMTYRSTGYFTNVVNDVYYPFKNDNTFDSVFSKTCRGLKIVIPYLREQFNDHTSIIRAVCDNFFVAILKGELIVFVNGKEINKDNIINIVLTPEIYEVQEYSDIKDNFTPLYIRTFTEKPSMPLFVKDKKGNSYSFDLYIAYDERIKRGRTAIIRGIGMKIEDRRITSHATSPYNAVLIPRSSNCDNFLKKLENESHTKLSSDHIKNPQFQANAKYFINDITRKMQPVIAELLRQAHPTDGVIDTSEQFYTTERNFKKEFSKTVSTVQISKGKDGGSKELVKVSSAPTPGGGASGKGSGKRGGKGTGPGAGYGKGGLIDFLKKALTKSGCESEKQQTRFPMRPETVKRIVLKDTELLSFDLNNVKEYSGENACDISISVIDGTGARCDNEFNINNSYSSVANRKTGKTYSISGATIHDVDITDGRIDLKMSTEKDFNKSLKLMYYIEV